MNTTVRITLVIPEPADGEQAKGILANAHGNDNKDDCAVRKPRKRRNTVHQTTTLEAVAEWRNEGNPN